MTMSVQFQDIEFWHKAMDGKVTRQEWVAKLQGGGFRSGVDFPISLFYMWVEWIHVLVDFKT